MQSRGERDALRRAIRLAIGIAIKSHQLIAYRSRHAAREARRSQSDGQVGSLHSPTGRAGPPRASRRCRRRRRRLLHLLLRRLSASAASSSAAASAAAAAASEAALDARRLERGGEEGSEGSGEG
jgi:hypothetical protein